LGQRAASASKARFSHLLYTIGITAFALSAMGCGSPEPERREFVFTPVAYMPRPLSTACDLCGRGAACTADGQHYIADQVFVYVDADDEGEVLELLDSYGFTVLKRFDLREEVSLVVNVPLGSVPAAMSFLSDEEAVKYTELSGIARFPESPNPCRRP
jgi:hypothetical protein